MGLLTSLRRRFELGTLLRAYQTAPSPDGALVVAEQHYSVGRIDRAVDMLRTALQRFPRAESLYNRYLALRKQQLTETMRGLKAQLAVAPTAEVYASLARLYLELDELERVREACRDCMARFPAAAEPYLLLGELRLWRWRQDWLAHDGNQAFVRLTEAAERDRACYRALRLMTELLLQVGAGAAALRTLMALRRIYPRDQDLIGLERIASALPVSTANLDQQFEQVERQGEPILAVAPLLALAGRVAPPSRALGRSVSVRHDVLTTALQQLAQLPGFRASLVAVGDTVLASAGGSSESAQLAAMLKLAPMLNDAALRMDIGRCYRFELELADGLLLLADCVDIKLLARFAEGALAVDIWPVIDQAIALAFSVDQPA